MSVSFRRLLEQTVDEEALFSPFYRPVKTMDPEEVELLDEHPTIPSENTSETPPSQVEWQWVEDNVVYNTHLVKEVYDDSRKEVDITDPGVSKRYKAVTFAYNKNNNQIGMVLEFSDTSENFNDPFNVEVLSDFLDNMEFLSEAETGGEERYWFSRLLDPQF